MRDHARPRTRARDARGDLPSVTTARLPAIYANAKVALAECQRLDECQDWADRMEAMASYARQAQDESLRRMCDRIQARASRRCGELLQSIQPARGANQNISGDAPTNVQTRTQAATDAGLSRDQRVTHLRVANVPAEEFEAAVESADPPTVTELARIGTVKKPPKPSTMIAGLSGRRCSLSRPSIRRNMVGRDIPGFRRKHARSCAHATHARRSRHALASARSLSRAATVLGVKSPGKPRGGRPAPAGPS